MACLIVAACGGAASDPRATATPPSGLEAAAIEAGVIPDPASAEPTGLYARDGDRLCIVPGDGGYRVGLFVDYADQSCEGTGTATRRKDTLDVDFGKGCAVSARFDGDRVTFPGDVPAACDRLCRGRGTIAGVAVDQLSDSVSEATAMRDARGNRLCS